MGFIVVADCMRVEQLSGVVGVVAGLLEPDGEEVVVEPAIHEFRVASYKPFQSACPLAMALIIQGTTIPYGGRTSVTLVL